MLRVAALIALLAMVVGCSGGEASPPPTTPTGTSAESARPSVAPPVGESLDLGPFRRHPCGLLNARQAADLGFPRQDFEGAEQDSGLCMWRRPNDTPGSGRDQYSLTVHVSGDPLGTVYRDGSWVLFEERQVGGLPAVVHAYANSDRLCYVVVGAGNGQGITVAGSPAEANPGLCRRLVDAAGLVVDAARR